MHNVGFDMNLQEWFNFEIPQPTIAPFFIEDCLTENINLSIKPTAKIVWLGGLPSVREFSKSKKGFKNSFLEITFYDKTETFQIKVDKEKGEWFLSILSELKPSKKKQLSFSEIKTDFETHFEDFELFWFSKPILTLNDFGLLTL